MNYPSTYLQVVQHWKGLFTRQRAYPASQVQDSRRLFLKMNRRSSALQKTDKFIVERLAAQILVRTSVERP